MSRSRNSVASRAKRKSVVKQAKGFRGRSSTCFRVAFQRLEKAWKYATRDRKSRKRDFRALWIQRINAGTRQYGLRYSDFVCGLKNLGVLVDRKMLSELACSEPEAFKYLVDEAKASLKKTKKVA